MRPTLVALTAFLLWSPSRETRARAFDEKPGLLGAAPVRNVANRERRLRVDLDSAMLLVEVTSEAASVEVIAPCGTFLDPYSSDATLARWADLAAALPAPASDSAAPGGIRYSSVSLGDSTKGKTPYDNTTLTLTRLDTAVPSSYSLTSTNTAWACAVRLDPRQAAAFLGALRGDTIAPATPYDLPVGASDERGRPHVSGAWLGPIALDREAELKKLSVSPSYPKEYLREGISETVRLMFIVDSTGRVRPSSVRLIGPAHSAFALSAVRAILSAEYRPAERGGRPVPTFMFQDFRFSP